MALLRHAAPGLSHTALTLPLHSRGGHINAIETLNPRAGSDTTLFLLHGWGAGLAMYYRVLPSLPYATVFSVDLPGMGASSRERLPGQYCAAVDYFIDALDEAYQHLSARRACRGAHVLAGHSLGGFLAAEWQLRLKRFDALVLVSPVGVPRRPPDGAKHGLVWRLARRLWGSGVTPQTLVRALGRAPVRSFVRARFELPEEDHALVSEYMYVISAAKPGAEKSMNVLLEPGAWAKVPLQGRLDQLEIPVAFLYGEHDWMDWKAGEEARKEIVWSCLERVPKAGHHVFVDNPKAFVAAFERVVGKMEKEIRR